MAGRINSTAGELARRGFTQVASSAELVEQLVVRHSHLAQWLDVVANSANPDRVLSGLHRLDQLAVETMKPVWEQAPWFARVVAVLGASGALMQHLIVCPADVNLLRDEPLQLNRDEMLNRLLTGMGQVELVGSSPDELKMTAIKDSDAADGLRLGNRREIMRIAARDLQAENPIAVVDSIATELADLADAVLSCALMLARGEVAGQERVRLAVIALGKCGARELNYISDVDVLYVGEAADKQVLDSEVMGIAGRLAGAIARICSAHTLAGSIWQVDAALRPEGNAGPLVRTLESHQNYYERWAHNWEFQAMMKARPMAGDFALGKAFCDFIQPKVWQIGSADNFVSDTQAMRRRVVSLISDKEAEREIKLGKGGLRDVEFTVQLLQLVHARADERIRLRGTFESLRALVDYGYIGRDDGAQLEQAYRTMRVMEHRVQLNKLRRTHLMPTDETELTQLGRAMRLDRETKVWSLWRKTSAKVSALHERVFYSPLLEAASRLNPDELKLSPEAAQTRLKALGFLDAKAAFNHIAALTRGISRSAEIQRQLMAAMLGWFADGPNPDLGLLAFRQLSESLGGTSWYLRALRDEGSTAERLAHILSSSRYIGELLRKDPASVELLISTRELTPRSREDLVESMSLITDRHDDAIAGANSVRAFRRRELFRLAVGDVLGLIDLNELGQGLSDLAAATIQAALNLAAAELPDAPPVGVVAMGRLGGRESSYGSDADVMFVVADQFENQLGAATQLVARARELLSRPGAEPSLELDADLRPEGRSGPLVRTLSSYLAYYQRWSLTWESQALIRAAYGAGDQDTVERLLAEIDSYRWPADGLSAKQLAEIRKLKARMSSERISDRVDPTRQLKLGPGGLSDVEWSVQLLQLCHGGELAELRTTNTLEALAAAVRHNLISVADAADLEAAWVLASKIRNATMLVRGRAQDTLPADARDIAAAASLLGYGRAEASKLVDDWGRTARHASRVVDAVFWGKGQPNE